MILKRGEKPLLNSPKLAGTLLNSVYWLGLPRETIYTSLNCCLNSPILAGILLSFYLPNLAAGWQDEQGFTAELGG